MQEHPQGKQPEWRYQWEQFRDDEPFLFWDWIQPRTLEDFKDKRILDAGCGPAHHITLYVDHVAHVTGLDLNTADLAQEVLGNHPSVSFVEADIVQYQADEPYDVVYSLGVVDHTDDPDRTFDALYRLTRSGGLTIVWVWSEEGNSFMRYVVEPLRKRYLQNRSRGFVEGMARLLTAVLYLFVYSIYLLPLRFLPYYEYFQNFRRLTFERNALNIFDKLNSPYTEFISYERMQRWFDDARYQDISITSYRGVSWRGSGVKK
ncbi:MAG: class I SAM-dependent methyltransferase [Anaerolineae bacterium]